MRRSAPLRRVTCSCLAVLAFTTPPAAAETVRARVQVPAIAAAGRAEEQALSIVIPRGHRVTSVQSVAVAVTAATGTAAKAGDARPLVEMQAVGAWHGYQIASLRLHPLQPRGAGVERADVVEVVVQTAPGGPPPRARRRANPALSAREADLVRGLVANPEQVARFAPPPGSTVVKRGGFQPAAYPGLEGSDVEYVIVTSAALAPAFQSLADWKTLRGVPTVVRTLESIEAVTRHGCDIQETVRTFLQDAYANWSVQWVLLGGDTDVLPARFASSSFGIAEPEAIPCDLYFAALDGNWNADGDALWGEAPAAAGNPDPDGADLLAELYLSRAPVSTPAQVGVFTQKVVAYETPADPTYQASALFLGEVLFPVNWDTTQTITMDGAQLCEDIIVQRFPPTFPVVRRYEDWDSFSNALPLSRAASLAAIQGGVNLVNHVGHGFRYNMSVADQSIVNADADGLGNTNRYSVLNILNCTSLAFDYSCLGEHFINNPAGGAVAVVGASRSAYPLPSREYQDDYYQLLFSGAASHAGELFTRSRLNQTPLAALESAHRWTHYIYNMLGDPEMTVFSALPASVSVAHPAAADVGANTLLLTVTAAAPVAGARVCLQKGLEDYQVGITAADGSVSLPFTAESPGLIQVTVSGRNLRTWGGTIPVTPAAGPYVHVQAVSVDDDALGGTIGNGDGVLDAGETVDLTFTLRNDGAETATTVSGVLACADANVTLLGPIFGAVDIAPAGSALATAARVRFAAATPDRHVARFTLALDAGAGPTQDKLEREIHAPKLELVRLEVLDTTTGNGNGEQEEDEIVEVRAWVKNFGTGRADGVNAVLQATTSRVTIVQGTSAYGTLASMGETANAVLFQLKELFLSRNFINLRLTDSHGRLVIEPFELRRPNAPATVLLDPSSGPTVIVATWPPAADTDLAGYHLYRGAGPSGPWTRATVDATRRVAYFRDTGLATNTRYWYAVTTVDSSGNESLPSSSASVSTNPPQLAGWPITMSAETASSPAIGDLDGDGLPEIVQGDSRLYAWHGNGVEVRDADADPQTWGVFTTELGTVNASVVLAELDGGPGLEVLACAWDVNRVVALDGDGGVLWTREPPPAGPAGFWGTPTAADVDRDGRNEVFAPSKDGFLYAWNHDGSPLLAEPNGRFASTAAYSRSSPAIGNLDADFELEIVITDVAGNLHAWNADGAPLAGFPKAYGVSFYNSPVMGDVDGDGNIEIVAIHQSGANNLHCLRGDGTELAGFPTTVTLKSPSGLSPTPALADLDADGRLELVIGSNEYDPAQSRVYVLRWDGTVYPGWPQPTQLDSESSPIVADFDGDGSPDIVFGGQEGVMHGWRSDGSELLGFPLSVGDFIRGTPAASDLDADGHIDLVVAAWDRNVYIWDFPAVWHPAQAQWPCFLHDAQRTALHGFDVRDATDTGDDPATVAPPAQLELAPNRPNPFNPSTTIAYGLPQAAPVRLEIFDVRGRALRRLVDAPTAAGRHTAVWDGRDSRGREVPSGVYFYRLRAGDAVLARRMLLVR
jgi:hypothetical protein